MKDYSIFKAVSHELLGKALVLLTVEKVLY
jgi:hypothetical protein